MVFLNIRILFIFLSFFEFLLSSTFFKGPFCARLDGMKRPFEVSSCQPFGFHLISELISIAFLVLCFSALLYPRQGTLWCQTTRSVTASEARSRDNSCFLGEVMPSTRALRCRYSCFNFGTCFEVVLRLQSRYKTC